MSTKKYINPDGSINRKACTRDGYLHTLYFRDHVVLASEIHKLGLFPNKGVEPELMWYHTKEGRGLTYYYFREDVHPITPDDIETRKAEIRANISEGRRKTKMFAGRARLYHKEKKLMHDIPPFADLEYRRDQTGQQYIEGLWLFSDGVIILRTIGDKRTLTIKENGKYWTYVCKVDDKICEIKSWTFVHFRTIQHEPDNIPRGSFTSWQLLSGYHRIPLFGSKAKLIWKSYPGGESAWYYYDGTKTRPVSDRIYEYLKNRYIQRYGGWEKIDLEHTDYNGKIWW